LRNPLKFALAKIVATPLMLRDIGGTSYQVASFSLGTEKAGMGMVF